MAADAGRPLMSMSPSDCSDISDASTRNSDVTGIRVNQPPKNSGKNVSWFVVNLCVLLLLNMIMITYNVSVVRTIEKRFSLTSTQTGLTWSMNDITHICLVTFVAYFAQKSHKPRVLSVTMSFSAVAAILMVLPYFLFPVPKEIIPVLLSNQSSDASLDLCTREFPGYSHDAEQLCTESQNDHSRSSKGAWYIFIFAQLLNGVGGTGLQTLGLAYIDENVSSSKSNLYVGVVTSMYAFGPIIGLLLSAVALQFPETPWEEHEGTPKDPMWIGCWWFGFALCAVVIVIAVIPMWFFPSSMSSSPPPAVKPNRRDPNGKVNSALKQFKAFPKSLMSLLSNKAYMTLLIMVVCMAYIIQGVFSQLVRYIEIHFMVPAFTASIIAAVVSAGAGAVGGFMGGVLMTWWKLTPRGASWMLTVSMGATAAGIAAAMLMGCPQVSMAGAMGDDGLHVGSQCSQSCACEEGKSYNPVCGSDGLTYFSPCHAGCTSFVNETYAGCSCLNATGAPPTAISGQCPVSCNLLIPYAIVIFLMCFLGSVARVPGTILQFRIVKVEEKSFALGLISFAMNLLALIPGPVLFGSLIDKSCILWQKTCSGESGVCLLFDTAKFRYRTYGVTLAFEVTASVLSFVLVYLVYQIKFVEDSPLDDMTMELPKDEDKNGTTSREERV